MNTNNEVAEEDISYVLELNLSTDCSRFLCRTIELHIGLILRFTIDAENCESVIPKKVLDAIQLSVLIKPWCQWPPSQAIW